MSTEADVIAVTRRWVEQVVLGLNLCPFAHKPARNDTIRYAVSRADSEEPLVEALIDQLIALRDADHSRHQTTLLIVPECLAGFHDYNRFLDLVDVLLRQFALEGVIQVASFHPDYQFADLAPDDVRNYTNRSPWPMFHLILEADVERARHEHPDVDAVPAANMRLLQRLGLEQVQRRLAACRDAADG